MSWWNRFLKATPCCAFAVGLGVLLAMSGGASTRSAAAGESVQHLTERQLHERLTRSQVSITWHKVSLRRALRSLAHSQQLAILLDRRVDPNQSVDLTLTDEPLEAALEKLAGQQNLGVSILGPVIYFGPVQTAGDLRTLSALRREELTALPAAARRKMSQSRAWRWELLATPRDLLAELEKEAGVRIDGVEQIPHDLWRAADLPPLPWTDRLSLVAVQFDLTFEFDPRGRFARLTPIPAEVAIERTYPGGTDPQSLAHKWSAELPSAHVTVAGDKVAVLARLEDHERLARAAHGLPPKITPHPPTQPAAGAPQARQVFKLAVKDIPLSQLLKQFRQKLKVEFHYDQAAIDRAGISLDQLVSFKVENVPLEELLFAALKPARLGFRVHGQTVEVFPAEEK